MRKSYRKAIAFLLMAAMMVGCMAMGVNASATYSDIQNTAGDNQGSDLSYIRGIMRYYYDTANVSILTRVASYSEFIAIGSYSITIGNESRVYLYNTAEVMYANGLSDDTQYRGEPFYPTGNIRKTESGMTTDAFNLNTTVRTTYALSGHGLCTYNTNVHPTDEALNVNVQYPRSGERQIYYVSNVWE